MPSVLFLACILLISFTLNNAILATTQVNMSEIDRQALLCFKSGISFDPYDILDSWRNDSLNFCSWDGVTCGTKFAPRVVSLDLTNTGDSDGALTGLLSACLANLTFLSQISLANNSLSGTIPEELGKIPNLHTLMLAGNNLQGNIPLSLGTSASLSYVNLANNSLSGVVPDSLASSLSLIVIILSYNNLCGEIPAYLFNDSSNLITLDLQHNALSGKIPYFQRMSTLQFLGLTGNFLVGRIPACLGNTSSLHSILLAQNNLEGPISETLGQIPNLTMLDLSDNRLSGYIPATLYNASSLTLLGLGKNNTIGQLPSEIGRSLPYLTTLTIQGNKFSGLIPDSITNMSKLQVLDLSDNFLRGVVPSLRSLANLNQLFLGNNMLEPQDWALHNSHANFTRLSRFLMENNVVNVSLPKSVGNLSTKPEPINYGGNQISRSIPGTNRKSNAQLLLIVTPLVIISFLSILFVVYIVKKGNKTQSADNYKDTMKRVSYSGILKATSLLSPVTRISSSLTASVHIGRFEFETDLVAIKVFHLNEQGSENSFLSECEVLKNTRHRNLVQATTLCSTVDFESNEFKAIVYEFMANGSLDKWIHPSKQQGSPRRKLSLGQTINVAMDVANAIDYMHNQLTPPLIHCDLKPSNVLLDYDMTSRIGDFGSAKFLSSGLAIPEGLVGVGGTIGYIAPEYGMGCKISTGGDVYSFGVLLLEMLTAMRPTDVLFCNGLSLHKYVDLAFPYRIGEVLDPHMPLPYEGDDVVVQNCIIPLIGIGLMCSMESLKDRPGMRDVCAKIGAIKEAFVETY